MPTLKLTVFEPIEIVLGDEIYKIESLSSKMLGEFQEAVAAFGTTPETVKVEQLADILVKMIPGMTRETAMTVDIRHVVKIAEFLAEQITEASQPGKVKN